MKYLGIDLGNQRVGLAISDQTNTIASPYKVIPFTTLFQELTMIIQKETITDIVIGLPKNMNNTLGLSAQKAQTIAEKIAEQYAVNVHLQDERRSTIAASEYLQRSNMSRKNRRQKIDATAAAIILQTFLDRRDKNGRKNDI